MPQRDLPPYEGELAVGMRVELSIPRDGVHRGGTVVYTRADGIMTATIARDDGEVGNGVRIMAAPYDGRAGWKTTCIDGQWNEGVVNAYWPEGVSAPTSKKPKYFKIVQFVPTEGSPQDLVEVKAYFKLRRALKTTRLAGPLGKFMDRPPLTHPAPVPRELTTTARLVLRAHPRVGVTVRLPGSIKDRLSVVRLAARRLMRTLRDMQGRDERTAACAEGITVATLQKRLNVRRKALLREVKRPATDARRIGLEIEFISELSAEQIEDKLIAARLHPWVNLTDDGSVEDDSGFNGHELRVLVTEDEAETIIPRVTKCLSHDCKGSVNRTCGLHVHLDMRGRAQEEIEKIYANLVRAHGVLQDILPPSRRANKYCRVNRTAAWNDETDRYVMVNSEAYERHKTLEIRSHAGTLDAKKIIYWVRILLAVRDAEFQLRAPSTAAQLATWAKLSAELTDYINMRQRLFTSAGTEGDAHV